MDQGKPTIRTVTASEFRAKCLQFVDDVSKGVCLIVITKRGKPMAQLVPEIPADGDHSFIGATTGSMTIHGDIVKSLPDE